jgi:alkanesulfonate monooxygenase
LRDRATGAFTDPSKIHVVRHDSDHFQSEGVFISEPSPQRTPVLYQAGASTRGREFAAKHAECVFVSAPSRKIVKDIVADTRRRAADNGRDPQDIQFFMSLTAIPGRTRQEALDKHADYLRYANHEATAALFSGWTGIDLSKYQRDDPISYIPTQGQQSAVERYTTADPGRVWTVGEVLDRVAIGGSGQLAVGSAAEVADELQAIVEETGVTGFNLGYVLAHESFADFVELVIPELQRRGAYKREYRQGTLREKLFGAGPRLPETHPADQARRKLPVEVD